MSSSSGPDHQSERPVWVLTPADMMHLVFCLRFVQEVQRTRPGYVLSGEDLQHLVATADTYYWRLIEWYERVPDELEELERPF